MKFSQTIIYGVLFLMLLGFWGCSGSGSSSDGTSTGTLSLNLADAPLIDEANVTGVYITIAGIEYHTANGDWKTMGDFNTSINPINLLDWQDGNSISLGDFQLPSGKYTQMRFVLSAADDTLDPASNPQNNTGCNIEFNGDRNETLYVPSGTQTGYKAIGNYDVPINGTVTMTADFDVRKSIVVSGGGDYYKLKPTIKLIVTDEAGQIYGNVSNLETNTTYVVYSYEYINGISTWDDNETNDPDPSDSSDIRFPNAITSSLVKSDNSYQLSFLGAGDYDLIVAKYDDNGTYQTYYIETNITVESATTTTFNFVL